MAFDRTKLIPAYEIEFDEVEVKYNGGYEHGKFSQAMAAWAKKHPTKRIVDVKITPERYTNNEMRRMIGVIFFVDAESKSAQPSE
jgi:hypothetical protein